ncbi:DUF397 domain-containing protein [Streptomyces anandii]|uniref:DUF397 domain-containing protein n=1 Tax=Streptomyces anandii TaxID=285454 RepID=UPI0036F9C8CB
MIHDARLAWFKSSYSSGAETDSCLEVALALTPVTVHVRDSKHLNGPRLTLGPGAWGAFLPFVAEGRG